MQEALVKYLSNYWPHLTLVIGLAMMVAIATWYFSKKYYYRTGRVISNENKCSKIDHLISLKLNPLESAITQIHTSLNSLVVYLKSRDGLMDVTLFKAFSPIQLTEAGKYTLELMGGKKFVEENLEELFKSLESYEVDTPPDNPNLAPL